MDHDLIIYAKEHDMLPGDVLTAALAAFLYGEVSK
jgi:hypothetical protein